MSKRKRDEIQRCYSCNDPLGDSEALIVTGQESDRIHYVHRPSTRGKELCFTHGVQGQDSHSIAPKVVVPYEPTARQNVTLALHVGLDRRGCELVGVSYGAVQAARRGGGRRG